jgi:hypothetical protein
MSISETLRQAVRASGLPVRAVALAAGVPQPRLHYFLQGKGLTSGNTDRLADYFGLELRPRTRRPRGGKS